MAFPLPDNQLKYSAYDAAAPLFMYLDWTAQEKDSSLSASVKLVKSTQIPVRELKTKLLNRKSSMV